MFSSLFFFEPEFTLEFRASVLGGDLLLAFAALGDLRRLGRGLGCLLCGDTLGMERLVNN